MPPSTNIMFRTGSSARSERFGGGRERPSFKDCRFGADKGGNGIAEMEREIITGKRFGEERALYSSRGIELRNCAFQGEEDGESALKESGDVVARNCLFDLRYPMWHVDGLNIADCELTVNCRAALWYDSDVRAERCRMLGIKAFRECRGVELTNVYARSPEFGWKCSDLRMKDCDIESEYAFLESRDISADGLTFAGKYSFQYTENVHIRSSRLNTKDAFWHAKNVVLEDCVLDGEYTAWYSEDLTLVRCRIKGTQPFCYCKNLRLIDCTMEDCDLAFEYSDVHADIKGGIDSVKNPLGGSITADGIGEIILGGAKYPCNVDIRIRGMG